MQLEQHFCRLLLKRAVNSVTLSEFMMSRSECRYREDGNIDDK